MTPAERGALVLLLLIMWACAVALLYTSAGCSPENLC